MNAVGWIFFAIGLGAFVLFALIVTVYAIVLWSAYLSDDC